MSTCPDCGGHLHAGHRCRGLWRRRLGVAQEVAVAALVGGTLGGLLLGRLGIAATGESFAGIGFTAGFVTWLCVRNQLRHRY